MCERAHVWRDEGEPLGGGLCFGVAAEEVKGGAVSGADYM